MEAFRNAGTSPHAGFGLERESGTEALWRPGQAGSGLRRYLGKQARATARRPRAYFHRHVPAAVRLDSERQTEFRRSERSGEDSVACEVRRLPHASTALETCRRNLPGG